MDWKVFLATFVTIFLAELGDKTQIANFSLAASSRMRLPVFLAAVSAFAVVTLITVHFGHWIGRFLKPEYIRTGAGILFIFIGVLMLLGKV